MAQLSEGKEEDLKEERKISKWEMEERLMRIPIKEYDSKEASDILTNWVKVSSI